LFDVSLQEKARGQEGLLPFWVARGGVQMRFWGYMQNLLRK